MLSSMRQTLNKHCVIHKQEILQKLLSKKEKVEHQLLWSERSGEEKGWEKLIVTSKNPTVWFHNRVIIANNNVLHVTK